MALDPTSLLRPYQLALAIAQYVAADPLQDNYDNLLADTIALKPYKCPKCQGVGEHELSLDTGNPADTNLIQCTFVSSDDATNICDGWGYLGTAVMVDRAAIYTLYKNVP